ncbi:MAG: OmpA family protein [Saprospiraceae bacterium]
MTALIIFICLVMLGIIVVQISRVREISASMRGEEQASINSTNRNGYGLLAFMIVFLVGTVVSALYYKDSMLGYGPWEASSAHGHLIDDGIAITLFFTGIVFVITHILLFWFAYRYRKTVSPKADYISHDNKLEVIWTLIPAVVMTGLVVSGLDAWNVITADMPDTAIIGEDYMEIEATGYQFAWDLRYPGADHLIGTKNFRMISGVNPLGQDWTDTKNHDDILPGEIVLPVGKTVRVRITSKDVLHNFYLPHFRVKMDAVPGMPTYFVFKPIITTDSMRSRLSNYPDYLVPSDPEDPASEPRWKVFNYELACAELCGTGHNSMRRIVRIVEQDEYDAWLATQPSYYLSTIRNTDDDPFKGQVIAAELSQQKQELTTAMQYAMSGVDSVDRIVRLRNISYKTGSANLTDVSSYELSNVVEILKLYPNIRVEIAGHTDNTGDPQSNMALSEARAMSVSNYLTTNGISSGRFTAVKGYGQTREATSNETPEGRAENRRTEFIVALSNQEAL